MRGIQFLAALPLAGLSVGLFATAALAQACNKPLSLRNEVQMTSANGGPSSIPVKINGTDQKLTLATAGTTTQLNALGVKALKLETRNGKATLSNPGGEPRLMDEVTIADFTMGTMHGSNVTWLTPDQSGRGGGGGGDDAPKDVPVGLFSLNYMMSYDVDADFGSDRLRFFAQDHCPGGVLYWKADSAVGVAPITVDNGRVTVPVMLDGKALTGVIDTASTTSHLYAVVAQRVLGVELGSDKAPADRPSRAFGGDQSYTYTGTLSIGPLSLPGSAVMVSPNLANKGGGPAVEAANRSRGIQFAMAHPEVVIGMDVLRKLHVYMAFGENKLYATTTTAVLPAAAPAKVP
jgi:hypothetical protein